jgi:hypothetical protein
MTKRSRLVVKKGPVRLSNGKKIADHSKTGQIVRVSIQNGCQSHLKARPKKCPRDGHLKTGPSGFRWGTVNDF